jgi:hypothetical protein
MNAIWQNKCDASELKIPPRELLATIFPGGRVTGRGRWSSNRPYPTLRFPGAHPASGKSRESALFSSANGALSTSDPSGRGGIRTLERLSALPVFKTGAIDHSATLPKPGKCLLSHRIGTPLPPPDTPCSTWVRAAGTHRFIAGFTAAACTTNRKWLSLNSKQRPLVWGAR